MEKKIKVVIGANFGDEGKGLMTDYFCNQLSSEGIVLNVRYNGGAQAGHTVVTPDGKRHVFSHFGSGSFNPRVVTFLSDQFILNPILFCREWNELKKNFGIEPEVYISRNCRITTPYDMIINQMVETHRGKNRHGSCGVGIYETVERNRLSKFWMTVGCIEDGNISLDTFLRLMRERYVPDRIRYYGISNDTLILPERTYTEFCEWIKSDNIIKNFVTQYNEMMYHCSIVDRNEFYSEYDKIVFEGAQGLLLSEDNGRYTPHVTASNTGIKIPMSEIKCFDQEGKSDLEVCYVTRSYLTRHGAGPLETECEKEKLLPDSIFDKTNIENEFQGQIRYGYFDKRLFKRSIWEDDFTRTISRKRSIAVTHLDETDGMLMTRAGGRTPESICDGLAENIYKSFGETRQDVQMIQKGS